MEEKQEQGEMEAGAKWKGSRSKMEWKPEQDGMEAGARWNESRI